MDPQEVHVNMPASSAPAACTSCRAPSLHTDPSAHWRPDAGVRTLHSRGLGGRTEGRHHKQVRLDLGKGYQASVTQPGAVCML